MAATTLEPTTTTARRPWLRGDAAFLLLLTLAAAALRFTALSRPTLWNDEVLTYSRVCGTHRQMIDILRDDGFGPLHYEVLWLMGRVVTLTPTMLRLVPAIAGTLMVPAMFLLAAELYDRRTARLAALLTAGSAYLLAYSRDAKMYMELWLAVTAHLALLLTALRTGRAWPWAGWWISGAAAAWLHASGLLVVPLDLLVLLLHPRGNVRRTAGALVAIAALLAGPAWYVATVSRVPGEAQRHGWGATGIGWVAGRTVGHATPSLLADTLTSFAFCFSWIDEPPGTALPPKWVIVSAAALLAALLLVVCLPVIAPLGGTRSDATDPADDAPQPLAPSRTPAPVDDPARTRATVLLCLWAIVPFYATYRVTRAREPSLTELLTSRLGVWPAGALLIAVGLALAVWLAGAGRWRWIVAGVTAAALALAAAAWASASVLVDPNSPVKPPAWLVADATSAVPAALAIVGLAALAWGRRATTVRQRLARAAKPVALGLVTAALCVLVDRLANATAADSIWMPRYLGFTVPALIVAVSVALLRLRWPAVRWATVALLLAVNLAQAAAHVLVASEPPLDRVAADIVAGQDAAARTLVLTPPPHFNFGPHGVGTVWNSCCRYYLLMATGRTLTPVQFRNHRTDEFFPIIWTSSPAFLQRALVARPDVTRLIVWDRPDRPTALRLDAQHHVIAADLSDVLPRWTRQSVEVRPVRSFWDWGTLYPYRRTVYTRSGQ